MPSEPCFDVVVVGGGPSGATAAHDLARAGRHVALLDRAGRIKPCGGAVPPRLLREFDVPEHLMVARVKGARIVAPSAKMVDMPIEVGADGAGYVGMVDRDQFDEWLRSRAALAGATRLTGTFATVERDTDGMALVVWRDGAVERRTRARSVIGADGANSAVARLIRNKTGRTRTVFAYHEVIRAPQEAVSAGYDPMRCDIYYQERVSPDFYGWVFPHGETASVGLGSAKKGFPLRPATAALRERAGLAGCETIRREGAPIPLKPLKRWDNGRDIVLAGDAAGVVAPASGEGIYYAMLGGRLAADAADAYLASGKAAALGRARARFMKMHGTTFWVLGIMQHFWYRNEKRRERFVSMCADRDVQRLTWEAYMNKKMTRADPAAHARIFLRDMGHLLGISRA